MVSLLSAPLVPAMYLRPAHASFDVMGGAIEGGTNLLGESISMEMTGGGQVTAVYESCMVEADDFERHEIINWLGARGNGGYRAFTVEIINDWISPAKRIGGITHSDGALFSDTSGYSQSTAWAKTTASAAVNAGVLQIRLYNASRDLRWSDWFSILHETAKGWRAYRYWKSTKTGTGNESVSGVSLPYADYELAIAPSLREATPANTRIEFARPKCVMRFPRGFTVPWDYEAFYSSRPTLQFVEAF